MIVFVDYEHAERAATEFGERLLAARTRITYRLEDLSGQPTMLVRYNRINSDLLTRIGASAIFISGQGTNLDRYDPADLESLASIVRDAGLPVFGFCGGFQFMAQALGKAVVPLGEFEKGYEPVDVFGEHPLLDGWSDEPVFRHAHGLHVPEVPDGFDVYASTVLTPVQLAIDDDRRMVGTQFHPEYWTDEHPAGRTLIANFMQWAGLVAG